MALVKMLQSMTKIAHAPPEVWKKEVKDYVAKYGPR